MKWALERVALVFDQKSSDFFKSVPERLDEVLSVLRMEDTRMRLWSALGLGRLAVLPATAIVVIVASLATMLMPWVVQAYTPWPAVARAGGIVVAVLMCSWSGRLIRRFSARLVPLRANGERRVVAAGACVVVALTSLVAVLLWARQLGTLARAPETVEFWSVTPAIAWLIAFVLLAAEYSRGRPRDGPYVLYLRTFLSFSDRAMMALLFSLVGSRRRVVVLTAPRSDAASWDPVLIAFRGNPIFRLRAQVPVFMTAAVADWQLSVRRLIAGATQTIVDVSALTPGVQAELEILRDMPRWHSILWLCEASRADVLDTVRATVGRTNVPDERVVFYTRSIVAALPGIAGGLGLSLLCLAVLPAIGNLQRGRTLDVQSPAEGLGRVVGALFPAVLFFLVVFARPAVDRQARHRLRSLLAER
jgi:hypothetical protein